MAKLMVAQCWDDGVATDMRLIELLRKYHAKATFNLNPGSMPENTIQSSWAQYGDHNNSHKGFRGGKIGKNQLLEVYGDFQVASHCWKHENADTMPPEQWIKCAVDARKYLEDLFQRPCPGFAWPCGVVTPDTCKLLRDAGFAYGRSTKNLADVTQNADAMALASNCHFQDSRFYQKYDAAKACGVFYFWGHSYETLNMDQLWEQLEFKLRMIAEDPDAEWVYVSDIAPLCDGKNKK